jgi:hypothetical protein
MSSNFPKSVVVIVVILRLSAEVRVGVPGTELGGVAADEVLTRFLIGLGTGTGILLGLPAKTKSALLPDWKSWVQRCFSLLRSARSSVNDSVFNLEAKEPSFLTPAYVRSARLAAIAAHPSFSASSGLLCCTDTCAMVKPAYAIVDPYITALATAAIFEAAAGALASAIITCPTGSNIRDNSGFDCLNAIPVAVTAAPAV